MARTIILTKLYFPQTHANRSHLRARLIPYADGDAESAITQFGAHRQQFGRPAHSWLVRDLVTQRIHPPRWVLPCRSSE